MREKLIFRDKQIPHEKIKVEKQIKEVEKVVEKIVEKIVEVPVQTDGVTTTVTVREMVIVPLTIEKIKVVEKIVEREVEVLRIVELESFWRRLRSSTLRSP